MERARLRSFTLTALAAGALVTGALSGCGKSGPPAAQSTTSPPTTAASPSPSPTAAPVPSAPVLQVLGPLGYGPLRLGMTRAQAATTGVTTGVKPTGKGACGGDGSEDGFIAGTPAQPTGPGAFYGQLVFSATTGKLVAIYAIPGVKTPQGIELGSTYATLHAAYPDWESFGENGSTDGRGAAKVPGNTKAHYRIVVQSGQVIELSLDSNDQDCYE